MIRKRQNRFADCLIARKKEHAQLVFDFSLILTKYPQNTKLSHSKLFVVYSVLFVTKQADAKELNSSSTSTEHTRSSSCSFSNSDEIFYRADE